MLIGKYYEYFNKNTEFNQMMKDYIMINILQHRPTFEIEEANSVYKYMLEDTFITEFKKTEELEKMICKYLNYNNMKSIFIIMQFVLIHHGYINIEDKISSVKEIFEFTKENKLK